MSKISSIRIHASGQGRITDVKAVKSLLNLTPRAFKKSQDLLVATKKYLKKSGLFSNETKRMQKIQSEYYSLLKALEQDDFIKENEDKKQKAYEYLSLFSDAFPNWQNEYETLNRYIPHF